MFFYLIDKNCYEEKRAVISVFEHVKKRHTFIHVATNQSDTTANIFISAGGKIKKNISYSIFGTDGQRNKTKKSSSQINCDKIDQMYWVGFRNKHERLYLVMFK